ncbi:MAG: 3-hydroxyacyl-CoA dehydrogenase NAD-binding domain-containing protein [Planctomycetota bacterium]|jgi:3-hydroxyacyl-CoA dehydrogenase/enoyl-CoA hydratase/3-hydroxybutyryl-CoA epimerase
MRLAPAGTKVVTLTEERLRSLEQVVAQLESQPDLKAVIVTGPGPKMFAAGADIKLIQGITDPVKGAEAAEYGQSLFARLGKLPVPVVGAIEGPCLGGGLELALCFDLRVASADSSTKIGLPEVKLGIIPGFGGTQRLSRLVGLPKALDMILTGKMLPAEKARKVGVVDRVVPAERLLDAAREEAQKLAKSGRKSSSRNLRGMDRWMSKFPPLRKLIAKKVGKTLSRGQARFYEAPPKALELCMDAFRLSEVEGLKREAKALGELIASPTSKGLVHLYFLTERAKRLGRGEEAIDIQRAMVVGGGAMGAGIAACMASKSIQVRLCDVAKENLSKAKARLQKALAKKLSRRRIRKHEAMAVQDRLAVSTEWGSLAQTDLFLEAVPENMQLKAKIFEQCMAKGLGESAVIATNTSSLSVDEMADNFADPSRVVGIHFFNPPEKMPLVEIIKGKSTSDRALHTACKLAVRLGKFPVVVENSPGFLVNRCLGPYINEAAALMAEGNSPEAIDQTMLDFGMPMGPARLLDEVGFDVAAKVSEVLSEAYPDRMQPDPLFAAMVEAGFLGQKSGGGLYDASGKKPGRGRAVLAGLRQLSGMESRTASRSEILERLVYPMVDEAYRCLDEGLVESESDLDLGLVMGMGFPPFTGGITRYAESEGLRTIVDALEGLAEKKNPRFMPSSGLQKRSRS